MPTRLFVRVREARGLPAIDRKRKTTDWYGFRQPVVIFSFVDVAWGDEHRYTKVKDNDLNPKWENASWTIDVLEESRLQDEPLVFNVYVSLDNDVGYGS